MLQLADFMCFFLRKHIELLLGLATPDYRDESENVRTWTTMIIDRSIPKNNIFLSRGRCEYADLFYENAPVTIRLKVLLQTRTVCFIGLSRFLLSSCTQDRFVLVLHPYTHLRSASAFDLHTLLSPTKSVGKANIR